ncbi:MAG: DeoR/GlpR family DNA-binding transcription regulator [Devosia sp.]|nr:DeoR/GlpR family DNA-binding transcription regulator [Devosia sp.]
MERQIPTQRERQARIREALIRQGEVSSADLARDFSVSIETVRRDLSALERKGQALRTHGGATSRGGDSLAHIDARIGVDPAAKQRIGKLAGQLLEAGMSVFIGGGSTALAAAWEMRGGVRASFVTNMVDVATTLSVGGQDDITLLGGRFFAHTHTVLGVEAMEMIDRRSFDLAFLGASAFDTERGLLSPTENQLQVSHVVRRRARKVAILATSSAFTRHHCFTALPLREIDMIITNSSPSARDYATLDAAEVEIHY